MRTIAVLVLVTLLAGCGGGADEPRPATTTPASAPTAYDHPTTPAVDDELPFTGPPRIAYVDGSVLRFPDGRTVQLPRRWGFTGIVRYAGGYLVTDDRVLEGTVGMQRLDADGRILDRWTSTGRPLVSDDGRVAWVSMVSSESGRTGPTLLHADSVDGGAEVTQELGGGRVPFLTAWFRGRLVYETWGATSSFLTDVVRPPRAIPRAEDMGLASPDGYYRARPTSRGIELLHQDGQLATVVRERGLNRTISTDIAWEDDNHVLTTLTRGGRQAIVRIALDGTVSRATG
ncbi:MAG TPA: hypothetical protein VGD39_14900, partial [Nocardioides sp.]